MEKPVKAFMEAAIEEAWKAKETGDRTVGAVIVKGDTIISRAGNRAHSDIDPTGHAEIAVIRAAAKVLGTKNLNKCILYTTHEPCSMCTSAAVFSKIDGIVFGIKSKDSVEFARVNDQKWRAIDIPPFTHYRKRRSKDISC